MNKTSPPGYKGLDLELDEVDLAQKIGVADMAQVPGRTCARHVGCS